MSIEDNDNYYVLNETEEKETDDSPLNFAAYEDSEEEESLGEKESVDTKKSAFAILFKIMFNPVEGWKTLRRSRISVEKLQSSCFYPILALLAVSCFADYFYSVNVGLTQLVTQAVVEFVAFFFGFFCIQKILTWLLPKEQAEKVEENYGKEYTIISLSTLALFSILTNLLPMLWPVLIFLPIWTLYIMFKGIRFFLFPMKQEMKNFVIWGCAVIGVPLLVDWILNSILPY